MSVDSCSLTISRPPDHDKLNGEQISSEMRKASAMAATGIRSRPSPRLTSTGCSRPDGQPFIDPRRPEARDLRLGRRMYHPRCSAGLARAHPLGAKSTTAVGDQPRPTLSEVMTWRSQCISLGLLRW